MNTRITVVETQRRFITLRDNGHIPMWAPWGMKRPVEKKWSDAPLPSDVQLMQWAISQPNIGVLCGRNRLLGADIDTNDPAIQSVIEEVIGKSPVRKRSLKRGYTGFYQSEEDPASNLHFKDKDNKEILQLLGVGAFCVIPPSGHPNGANYIWDDEGATLYNTPSPNLPIFKRKWVDELREALKPWLLERPTWSAEERANSKAFPGDHVFDDIQRKRLTNYWQATIKARVKDLAITPEGGRNMGFSVWSATQRKLFIMGSLKENLTSRRLRAPAIRTD